MARAIYLPLWSIFLDSFFVIIQKPPEPKSLWVKFDEHEKERFKIVKSENNEESILQFFFLDRNPFFVVIYAILKF